jgi:threonine dehydrogenase-like Zn-dependent dehydrogenase
VKSVAVIEPGRVELVDIPRPEIGPYEVLVKSELSFICNATDRKIVEGHFPGIPSADYPVLLGHETVGIVEAVGEKVRTFAPGQRTLGGLLLDPPGPGYTSGWGGNSEYVIIPDYQALHEDTPAGERGGINEVFKIMKTVDKDIPVEAAGMLCTWREVYAAFSDFRFTGEEHLVIFGAGPVGLSFTAFARIMGFPEIIVVDPIPEKRERASALGAHAVFSPEEDLEKLIEREAGGKVDAVVDAVGSVNIINSALNLIRLGGAVCVYGVLSDDTVLLNKAAGPMNFNLFMHQWPTRDYEAAAQEPLCAWIREGKLRWEDFVTGQFEIDEFPAAYAASQDGLSVKTLVRYE